METLIVQAHTLNKTNMESYYDDDDDKEDH